MKLWRLSDPYNYGFARSGRVGGTWQEAEYRERKHPIIIEWEPDSDIIGDFTWPGLATDILVTDRVGSIITASQVEGFELLTVEMRENSEPKKRPSKGRRVRLPYSGPRLWDLWVTAWTHIDRSRSTITVTEREDGSVAYEVSGVERRERIWDQRQMELVTKISPRTEGQGLFVPPIRGIFRIEEFPAWVFCTNDIKQLIEKHGFTNVSFLEMGEVLNK